MTSTAVYNRVFQGIAVAAGRSGAPLLLRVMEMNILWIQTPPTKKNAPFAAALSGMMISRKQ